MDTDWFLEGENISSLRCLSTNVAHIISWLTKLYRYRSDLPDTRIKNKSKNKKSTLFGRAILQFKSKQVNDNNNNYYYYYLSENNKRIHRSYNILSQKDSTASTLYDMSCFQPKNIKHMKQWMCKYAQGEKKQWKLTLYVLDVGFSQVFKSLL